jgi:hypothetical protein
MQIINAWHREREEGCKGLVGYTKDLVFPIHDLFLVLFVF